MIILAKKQKDTKEVKKFRWKFTSMVLIVDAIAVILIYFIMPLVQNFPPLSEDFAFQRDVQVLTHVQQYTVAYILGISIHLFSFSLLMRNIYKYLNKYYRKEKISYDEVQKVRKDCINIPYKVFFVQIALFSLILLCLLLVLLL